MTKVKQLLVGLVFMVTGCLGPNPEDYAGTTPKLDIRQYLNGKLEAWGVMFNYAGKVDLQFHVTMEGKWQGNTGTLTEHFTYSDGRKESRVWTITFTDDTHFTATARDVVGTAKGSQFGNTMNMQYVLNAKRASGDTITLNLDDWLYLVDDKNLVNRTKIRKFGLPVGELMISFRKH